MPRRIGRPPFDPDDPPPMRLGRPPLDPSGAPSAQVNVRITARDYDRVYKFASAHRLTMTEAVRQGIRELLEKNPPKP